MEVTRVVTGNFTQQHLALSIQLTSVKEQRSKHRISQDCPVVGERVISVNMVDLLAMDGGVNVHVAVVLHLSVNGEVLNLAVGVADFGFKRGKTKRVKVN